MLQFTVDDALCVRCRQCVMDCPARIIEQEGVTIPVIPAEREERCIRCQHCLAVCPTGAVSIFGKQAEDSLPVDLEAWPTAAAMTALIRGRRSVRRYRDADVDPALLSDLLTTLAHAPSGVNKGSLTFTLIDDRAVMDDFQTRVMDGLAAAAAAGRIPERFGYLTAAASWPREYGVQLLFRGAPHALIVSAPPDTPCPQQDIPLALAYFDLLAASAGLGTVWWGMCTMLLIVMPELKEFLGLPAGHPYGAMLFGYPAVRYSRTVQREDAAVVRRVEA